MTVIYVLLNVKKPDTQGIWLSKNYQSILGRDTSHIWQLKTRLPLSIS